MRPFEQQGCHRRVTHKVANVVKNMYYNLFVCLLQFCEWFNNESFADRKAS